ncbi:DNA phosphorothioation-dependent restriction protein DptF [Salimicrobium flavidum]|uniref:DNA phosphorothioation-dependent restriction protein DptF n=1 Tax=Salimicrobium flavidum TaxID=570947 RepID=A0A1N7KPA6_9BACI|nr:DNA phosphorothioation-dependent restriction protein DptF [Salimicrobium flavidum]SIS63371.1 DNA phosphorothioation-dependent restriction protein DptF [Salimicrobium flavidum]
MSKINEQYYLFQFVESLNEDAFITGKRIEDTVYENPQSACIAGRQMLEAIIEHVFNLENIDQYGMSLFDKINYLDRKGYFTQEAKQSMDTIRVIGNKAAHEPKFDDVEKAIKVFKEIYKIARWYAEVYSFNLEIPEYRNPSPPSSNDQNPDEIIEEVMERLRKQKGEAFRGEGVTGNETSITPERKSENKQEDSITPVIPYELPANQSYLLKELRRLQESSQEAVDSPEDFSELKDYMHVDRQIQIDLEKILSTEQKTGGPSLVLLSGSVGDGKSHLLSYLNNREDNLLKGYRIYNDATESFDPQKSAVETLTEELDSFSDQRIDSADDRVIIAINLGILNNFLEADHGEKSFNKLKEFINNSHVFEANIQEKYSEGPFHIMSFSDYQPFELTEEGPRSSFFELVFEKVFNTSEKNPFYAAYLKDKHKGINVSIHDNYQFMMNKTVQHHVIDLLINTIVQHKLVISARSLFNFIADIVIPEGYSTMEDLLSVDSEKLNHTTPELLFNRKERSYILDAMNDLDPIHYRSKKTDDVLIALNTLDDWESIISELIEDKTPYKWFEDYIEMKKELGEVTNATEQSIFKALIRTAYLTSEDLNEQVRPESFDKYMKYLYAFHRYDKKLIQDFYTKVPEAMFYWMGSPKKDYIYIDNRGTFKIAQHLKLNPSLAHLEQLQRNSNGAVIRNFHTTLTVAYTSTDQEYKAELNVDYHLYKLILAVLDGYRPNKKDEEDAIQLIEFVEKALKFGSYKKELLVHIPSEHKLYRLEKNVFGSVVFERDEHL